ncbi:MAG: Holliday junction resolvase RuvX, partial [Chthoniobacterales bacterium]|nr:Holliday junction resolvase RuvX [Chthoniobacterales bacterium]
MKRIMGIDYGTARIGIAFSDELQMLAHPGETIVVGKGPDPLQRIAALTLEKNVERIVVGFPRHMNGTTGESAEKARGFAEKLQKKVACEVRTWD